MLRNRFALLLGLAAVLGGCAPLATCRDLETQNAALRLEVERNQGLALEGSKLADHTTALAQQNLDLKMDKAALQQQNREKEAYYDSVTKELRAVAGAGQLTITRYKDMLTLEVADELLFDSARAALKAGGKAVLRKVGKALAESDKTIRVVGHTDNAPLKRGAGFATNWELSTARATTVVRFLQEKCGLDPKRLLAAGRGQWMPAASNATPAGRQRNRRIVIMLIDQSVLDGSEGY